METKGKICVFGASSGNIDDVYVSQARELGKLLAQGGWQCVNGAGSEGLMRAVSDGVLDAGGHVTGVIPKFMVDNGWCYDRLSEIIITPDMHTRKEEMSALCDAIIALPGGCGTIEELAEVITWRQLKIITKPIIVLNTNGYYDDFMSMLTKAIEQGFMKSSHHRLWTIASTPAEAIAALEAEMTAPAPTIEPK